MIGDRRSCQIPVVLPRVPRMAMFIVFSRDWFPSGSSVGSNAPNNARPAPYVDRRDIFVDEPALVAPPASQITARCSVPAKRLKRSAPPPVRGGCFVGKTVSNNRNTGKARQPITQNGKSLKILSV